MKILQIRIAWCWLFLAMFSLAAVAAPDAQTNSPADPAPSQKRPRSLREARARNGLVTYTNIAGVHLWDNRGRELADLDYAKKLLEVFVANVNRLVDAGREGGSGAPTEGLSIWLGFRLNRKGELSNVRVLKSELPELDSALAIRALELSSPLDPWSQRLIDVAEGKDLDLQIALSSTFIHRNRGR